MPWIGALCLADKNFSIAGHYSDTDLVKVVTNLIGTRNALVVDVGALSRLEGCSNGTDERNDNLLHSHGADGVDVFSDGVALEQRTELNNDYGIREDGDQKQT